MSNQQVAQSQEMGDDAFLSTVGSLLTQRVAAGPSPYEAEVANNFATYLRNRRQQLGLTQADVAQLADATEFELYALEQSMLLPREIEYVLLRKLARALDENVELFALLLERDIARIDRQSNIEPLQPVGLGHGVPAPNAKKRHGWRSGEWMLSMQKRIPNLFLSVRHIMRTAASSVRLLLPQPSGHAVGLICFALFLLGVNSFLAAPIEERGNVQASAPIISVDPEWVASEYAFEQRGPLEIVYTDKDKVWSEHMAYFIVDQQRVATVLYVEEPTRLNRWGCDMSLGNAYGPCKLS